MKSENRVAEELGLRVLKGILVLGWLGVCSLGVRVAMAQWVSFPPAGEWIPALAIDPTTPATVYAGGDGRVF